MDWLGWTMVGYGMECRQIKELYQVRSGKALLFLPFLFYLNDKVTSSVDRIRPILGKMYLQT